MKSGVIKESTDKHGDAAFGQAAYLTKKGPQCTGKEVIYKNYGDADKVFSAFKDRLEIILEVNLPEESVEQIVDKNDEERNIYIHKGNITMSAITAVYRRDNNGKADLLTIENE